ncbi:MAG: hypothetical protein LH632_18700, partial [Rhodoferax sp.]|nr:hypothetical protein [Rhodoferax sp.]
MAGLVEQAALRAAVIMGGKQAPNPVHFVASPVAIVIDVIDVTVRGNGVMRTGMHHPVHQTLGLGQQQGAGQYQQHAGPRAPRQRQLDHHWRRPCYLRDADRVGHAVI